MYSSETRAGFVVQFGFEGGMCLCCYDFLFFMIMRSWSRDAIKIFVQV